MMPGSMHLEMEASADIERSETANIARRGCPDIVVYRTSWWSRHCEGRKTSIYRCLEEMSSSPPLVVIAVAVHICCHIAATRLSGYEAKRRRG